MKVYITPTVYYKMIGKNSYDTNVVTLFITCSECILYLVGTVRVYFGSSQGPTEENSAF